jgi:hypothetical protein
MLKFQTTYFSRYLVTKKFMGKNLRIQEQLLLCIREKVYIKACIKLPRDRFFKKETLELQKIFSTRRDYMLR